MVVHTEFKAGLVFGLETDVVHMMDEKENVDDEETTVIYLHLGILTISFLMC
jgi:hypothetical protein